jgi:hypothetical protein
VGLTGNEMTDAHDARQSIYSVSLEYLLSVIRRERKEKNAPRIRKKAGVQASEIRGSVAVITLTVS